MSRLLKTSDLNILELLRQDLKGEQQAIELYDKHIKEISNDEIRKKLIEIRDEEKVHFQELTDLINKFSK